MGLVVNQRMIFTTHPSVGNIENYWPSTEAFAFMEIICNGNWTEWSTIRGVIGRITSSTIIPELYDTKSNYQLIVSITKCKNVHCT